MCDYFLFIYMCEKFFGVCNYENISYTSIMFLLKKLKYFSFVCALHNKVCLCGGTINCCWNYFFRDNLRMICHIVFKWRSINFHQVEEGAGKILAPWLSFFKTT